MGLATVYLGRAIWLCETTFCWGCAKSMIYADKPATTDQLEGNIRRVIDRSGWKKHTCI